MKLRIVFLIKALGAGPGGGAERILTMIANGLAARGHDVSVWSFDASGVADFYSLSDKVGRIRLGLGNTAKRSGIYATARRLTALRKRLKAHRPDIVVGFMHSAFVPLSIASLGTGVKVVASERTSFAHYRRRPIERLLLRFSLRLVAGVTVNGDEVRKGFPRSIAARMTVLPNPVAKAHGLADPVGGKDKILLSVGGLREEKDHRTLIKAFARIAPLFPDWTLRIVGDGPMRAQLVDLVVQLGLENRVEFAGAVSAVEKIYCGAQLFVLPSRYEAFPNCVAEALAHGLPAVGFADCPGTNALIVPELNGDLVSGRDRVEALGDGLARLMRSPSLRQTLGNAAPSSVEDYSLDGVIDRWEQLLHHWAEAQ